MAKSGGLTLYDIDMKNRYTIDDEYIIFINKYVYVLIGNPNHLDETSTDHEYFIIHDDLFEKHLATYQNTDIALKVIPKYFYCHQSMKLVQIQDPG